MFVVLFPANNSTEKIHRQPLKKRQKLNDSASLRWYFFLSFFLHLTPKDLTLTIHQLQKTATVLTVVYLNSEGETRGCCRLSSGGIQKDGGACWEGGIQSGARAPRCPGLKRALVAARESCIL